MQADISGVSVKGLKGCKSLNKPPEDPKNPVEGLEDRLGTIFSLALFCQDCPLFLSLRTVSPTLWLDSLLPF